MNGIDSYNKIIAKYPEAKDVLINPVLLKETVIEADNSNRIICKFCHERAVNIMSVQLRSSDEGETLIHICTKCRKTF